jgi:hypothetical protein
MMRIHTLKILILSLESINSRIRTVNPDLKIFMWPRFGHDKNPDI